MPLPGLACAHIVAPFVAKVKHFLPGNYSGQTPLTRPTGGAHNGPMTRTRELIRTRDTAVPSFVDVWYSVNIARCERRDDGLRFVDRIREFKGLDHATE